MITRWVKRHPGVTFILPGCAALIGAWHLVGYWEWLMNSYGVFDNSFWGRFHSFVYNSWIMDRMVESAMALALLGIIAIFVGIWRAADPRIDHQH